MTRKTEPAREPSSASTAGPRERLDAMRVLPEPPAPLRPDGELELPVGLQELAEQLSREAQWLHENAPARMALRGAGADAGLASGRAEGVAGQLAEVARPDPRGDSRGRAARLRAAATRLVPLAAACVLAGLAIGPLRPPAPAPSGDSAALPASQERSGIAERPGLPDLSELSGLSGPPEAPAAAGRSTAEGDTARPRLIDLLENLNGPEFEAVMDLLENEESLRSSTETVIAI